MGYNLIDERWIPVERRSGKIEMIAPAEIADREDPPLRVASPRPDFDGGLLEFLIGLLQTAAAPANERAWEREYDVPPSPQALKKRFDTVRDAFFLDGDGPRFMQDLTVARDSKASPEPIAALLVDRIGESALHEAPSLFVKPGLVPELGFPSAAAALMALQTYAPAGGRGQLTSLRGGGPLTTLIMADQLWRTIWLNVLPRPEFEARVPGDASRTAPSATFPWMAKTRTSEAKGGSATSPQKVHPLQHLWGLPRRVRLSISPETLGTCAVTGASGVPVVREYLNRPDGTSYEGDYRHPWTPYGLTKPGQPWNPKKGSGDGLPYRDWPLFVTGNAERRPATVVSYFAATRRRERVSQPRLAVFGYAMNNMKPLRWCRAETPLVTVAGRLAGYFAADVEGLIGASEEVRKTLSFQVKSAWSDRPVDLDVFARLNPAFWSTTESPFFEAVHALRDGLEANEDVARDAARESWLMALHTAAVKLFNTFVESSPELSAPDLRRSVLARRSLEEFTKPSSPRLRKLVGLPVEESEQTTKPKATRAPKGRRESKR